MRWTLAVGQTNMTREQNEADPYSVPEPGRRVRGYTYHMEEHMRECVDLYCSLLGVSKDRLKKEFKTPFVDESKEQPCCVDEEIGGSAIGWKATKDRKRFNARKAAAAAIPKYTERLQHL